MEILQKLPSAFEPLQQELHHHHHRHRLFQVPDFPFLLFLVSKQQKWVLKVFTRHFPDVEYAHEEVKFSPLFQKQDTGVFRKDGMLAYQLK